MFINLSDIVLSISNIEIHGLHHSYGEALLKKKHCNHRKIRNITKVKLYNLPVCLDKAKNKIFGVYTYLITLKTVSLLDEKKNNPTRSRTKKKKGWIMDC